MPAHRHRPEFPSRTLRRRHSPSPRPERKSVSWNHRSRRRSPPDRGTRPMPPRAVASRFSCRSPLPDRVATAFHAGAVGPVEGVDLPLILGLGLLVLGLLVLPGAAPAGHGPDDRTDRGALAGIAGDRADRRTAECAPRGATRTFTPAHRRTRRLGRRGLRDDGRVDAGVLLGPHIALAIVLA